MNAGIYSESKKNNIFTQKSIGKYKGQACIVLFIDWPVFILFSHGGDHAKYKYLGPCIYWDNFRLEMLFMCFTYNKLNLYMCAVLKKYFEVKHLIL